MSGVGGAVGPGGCGWRASQWRPRRPVGGYLAILGGRSAATVEARGRIPCSLAGWAAERPGGPCPDPFTRTAVEGFL